jgi:Na+-driven multidrug efflux pump
MFLVDSFQIVLGGVIRGIGEQGESSILCFISYGLVTLPCTIIFSFWYDMKLHGILLAYICGIALNSVFSLTILAKSNWELSIDDVLEDEDKSNDLCV